MFNKNFLFDNAKTLFYALIIAFMGEHLLQFLQVIAKKL